MIELGHTEENISSQSRFPNNGRLSRLSSLALLSTLLMLLSGLLWKDLSSAQLSSALFAYPFQFDESEGMIVAETLMLDRGENIFLEPAPELFVAAPYPPLFYLLAWPAQHFVGQEPSFKIGRAISMLASLLAGVCLFGIVTSFTRRDDGRWTMDDTNNHRPSSIVHRLSAFLPGAIAAALWWSFGLVAFWGSLVKPDVLALSFGLCGLWWLCSAGNGALRTPHSALRTQVWWALPCFLAAFYTKQTAIAAGAAAVAWLLVTRPRVGLAFGAAYAAGVIVPTFVLNVITDGGYFYHMYTLHDLPWDFDSFRDFTQNFLSAYGAFVVPGMAAVLAAAGWWSYRRVRGLPEAMPGDGALLACFYLLMSVVAASGAGTHGGNHNHFLEWAAAACLGLGLGAAVIRASGWWQVRLGGTLVALFLLSQVPTLFNTPTWLGLELRVPPEKYTEGMMNIFQYVTNNGGEAYSDNVGLLLLTRKKLWSTDPFTQTHATHYKRWDESKLVGAIRDKRFSQIILKIDVSDEGAGAGDVSPGILQAVRDNYKLDQRNVENIYVPK